jgi:chromatin assembly factor 1 subunit A
MALLEMSLNIQETEATGRKRSHDEFAGESVKVEDSEDTKMQTCSQPEGECSAYHDTLTIIQILT